MKLFFVQKIKGFSCKTIEIFKANPEVSLSCKHNDSIGLFI